MKWKRLCTRRKQQFCDGLMFLITILMYYLMGCQSYYISPFQFGGRYHQSHLSKAYICIPWTVVKDLVFNVPSYSPMKKYWTSSVKLVALIRYSLPSLHKRTQWKCVEILNRWTEALIEELLTNFRIIFNTLITYHISDLHKQVNVSKVDT